MRIIAVLGLLMSMLAFSTPSFADEPAGAQVAQADTSAAGVTAAAQPDIKVDVDTDADRDRAWYLSPIWIAVGVLALLMIVVLVALAARGGGGHHHHH
jgi:hypothetical protein